MPDTPHIKRFAEHFPYERRESPFSRFEGNAAVESMLNDLADHIERLEAKFAIPIGDEVPTLIRKRFTSEDTSITVTDTAPSVTAHQTPRPGGANEPSAPDRRVDAQD